MLNWGCESPEESLKLLKKDNYRIIATWAKVQQRTILYKNHDDVAKCEETKQQSMEGQIMTMN